MSRTKQKRFGRLNPRYDVRRRRRHKRKSDAYHYRPLLEALEQRRLLTAVTGEYPIPGSHDAPVTTDIWATCDTDINPATVSAQTFAVHGMQTGQIRQSLSVSGDTVTLSPDAPFHAGELVQATATRGIEDLGGEPLGDPFVWQFRTATSGGTGLFGDSGQSLREDDTRAVALGDLDGDGDLDAFVANGNYSAQPNNVWLNDGSGSFTDSGQNLGESPSQAVVLGDVDGDGDLDAFVGKSGPNNVWLNDGSGNFSDSGQSLGNSFCSALALGDVDGDGDLDAFVGNGHSSGEPNKVWLNDGSGIFSDSGQRLSDRSSPAVVLGDADGDGDLDAFVAGFANVLWLNNGSGSFRATGQHLGGSARHAVALGDVDGDGDLDAFVADNGSQPNEVWLNDGSGSFTDSGQRLGDSRTLTVTLGDLDGDGDLDAFDGSWPGTEVWLNDGSGDFSDSSQGLDNSGSGSVALGDVDGDGDLDALVEKWGGNEVEVWLNADIPADLSVSMNNGQFLLTPGKSVTYTITVTNHGPEGVTGAIVTDDFPVEISDVSWTCIASAGASCTPSGTGNISDTISLPAGGTATYTAIGQVSLTASGPITNVATVAAPLGLGDIGPANNTAIDTDVVLALELTPPPGSNTAPPVDTDVSATYDEDIDPATVSAQTFAVFGMQTGQILESLSVDGDTVTLSPNAPFHPGEMVQATVTTGIQNTSGESLADPFVWQFRTATSGGTGLFGDSGQGLGNSDTRAVALGDVDGDGDLDAFVGNGNYSAQPNKVWLNDGSGTFTDSGQSLGNSYSRAVALGDVDGDGDLDAFVVNTGGTKVWLNDSSGSFSDSGQSLGNSFSRAVALGDVDGDGDLDAFVGNGHSSGEPNKVWLNDGSGIFTDSGQSLGDSYSEAVALGDLDGDGDLDAFVVNLWPGGAMWLNDGTGTFADSGQSLGDSYSNAVALGDVDGDGDLDAIVVHRAPGDTSDKLWLNDGNGTFSDSGQSLGNAWFPSFAALADLDGDGDLDAFVAASRGANKVWLNDGSGSFSDSGQSLGDSWSGAVALGDVDGDGDLDAFVGNSGEPVTVWLNQDPLPGDFDNDQDVDGDDFLIWQAGFGIQMGATRYDGDADSDGDVDGDDFLIWQSNFDSGVAAGEASAAPTARRSRPDDFDPSNSRRKAVDRTFAELDRGSARSAKRLLRDELLDELSLLK